MKNHIDVICNHFEKSLGGELPPSMFDAKFQDVLKASRAIAADPGRHEAYACIGRRLTMLALDDLHASMSAQREVAILRDSGKPL